MIRKNRGILNLVRFIAVRRLQRHKARTLLTIFGIVVGVSLFVGVRTMQDTILDSINSIFNSIAGKAELQVTGIDETGFDENLLEEVKKVEGVEVAVPVVISNTLLEGAKSEALIVLGVNVLDDRMMRDYKLSGDELKIEDPLMFITQVNSILLTQEFAQRHNIKTEETVRLLSNDGYKDFVVQGLLAPFGVAKVVGGNIVVMDVYSAQKMFGIPGKFNTIDIKIKDGFTSEQVMENLKRVVGDRAKVEFPAEKSKRIQRMLRGIHILLDVLSITALFVAMFLIFNTVSISVVQRRREIGILRAIGGSRRAIMLLFLMESAIMGFLGGIVGIFAGYFLAKALVKVILQLISNLNITLQLKEVTLTLQTSIYAVIVGIIVSILAALYPAREASKVDPLEVMRPTAYEASRVAKHKRNLVLGIILIVFGFVLLFLPAIDGAPIFGYFSTFFVLLGVAFLVPTLLKWTVGLFGAIFEALFGIQGKIAAGNVQRSVSRNSVTISAIMIGLTFVVMLAVFVASYKRALLSWLDASFTSEIVVTPPTKLPTATSVQFSPQIVDMIKSVEGVENVSGIRILTFYRYKGVPVIIRAIDMKEFSLYRKFTDPTEKFIEDNPNLAMQECMEGKAVLVSDTFIERRKEKLGNTIYLDTPSGSIPFKIAGIFRDFISDEGVVLIDRPIFIKYWKDDGIDLMQVYLKPNYKDRDVKELILKAVPKDMPVMVLTNSEFKKEMRNLLDQTFYLSYAMNGVAIIIAILSIINTLIASILDRYREIGVMRAIGSTKRQIRNIILLEACLLGIYGSALGVIVGTVLEIVGMNTLTVQATGWKLGTVIPVVFLLVAFFSTTLVAVLSGYYISRRAAELNIVEAVQYE